MKKFLLVVLIGMVLTMDVYGIIKQYYNSIQEESIINESVTTVYGE